MDPISLAVLLTLLIAGGIALHVFLKRTFNEMKPQTHNIVMLGGRGVGKTTILAGISTEFELIARGQARAAWKEFKELRLGTNEKTRRMIELAHKQLHAIEAMVRSDSHPPEGYLPPLAATGEKPHSYTFYLSSSDYDPAEKKTVTLNFIDYKGGLLNSSADLDRKERSEVVDYLASARIVIVAVDAPYVMGEKGEYSAKRHAPESMVRILREAGTFTRQSGLLLLVPCRCERYLRAGQANELSKAVGEQFKSLVEHFDQPVYGGRVKIAITPVQTVGCIEFEGFSLSRKDRISENPPIDIPAPVFWPFGPKNTRQYFPDRLDQPFWHILLKIIQIACENESNKTAAKLREALPKIQAKIRSDDGFQVLRKGV